MTKYEGPKLPRPKRTSPVTPTNPITGAYQVSDALWEALAPLIPRRVNTHPLGGGRPRVPDRTRAKGIFYALRTGVCHIRWIVQRFHREAHLLDTNPLKSYTPIARRYLKLGMQTWPGGVAV